MIKRIIVVFYKDGQLYPLTEDNGEALLTFDSHEEAFAAVQDHRLAPYAETVAVRLSE